MCVILEDLTTQIGHARTATSSTKQLISYWVSGSDMMPHSAIGYLFGK